MIELLCHGSRETMFVNPHDVSSIVPLDFRTGGCVVGLRNGESFRVWHRPEEVAKKIRDAGAGDDHDS